MWCNLISALILLPGVSLFVGQRDPAGAVQSQPAQMRAESQSTSRPTEGLPYSAARVVLKDGRVLRGDCQPADDELVLKNLAGELRIARTEINGVTWLDEGDAVAREFLSRLWAAEPGDTDVRLTLAQWAVENRRPSWGVELAEDVLAAKPDSEAARALIARVAPLVVAESQPSERAGRDASALPPPPLLTDAAINRLKLSEYPRDGTPEPVTVRFKKVRGEPDVEELARREAVRKGEEQRKDLLSVIEKGEPPAKLQAILNLGGIAWADRIEVVGDPRTFKDFRTRVLPNIVRGCGRSGCHGGTTNYVFRLPIAAQSGETFAYTTFAMLDEMRTPRGRLIDRDLPDASELPRLMLAGADGRSTHPPVKLGRVNPVFQSTKDPGYRDLMSWISSLRVPHPEYELSYRQAETARGTASRPARATQSAPASAPVSTSTEPSDGP